MFSASAFHVANAKEAVQLRVTATGSTDCKTPVWPAGENSHVVLKLLVAKDGSVLEGDIESGSGKADLDRAALEAFSHCHFATDANQKEPQLVFFSWPTQTVQQEKPVSAEAAQLEEAKNAESRGDWAMAVKLFRPLADQGNASAQNNLGFIYEYARGVPKDFAEALKWYRRAADQGDATGESNLAGMYLMGQGVPLNYEESLNLYRKAAAQRFPGAFLNLGHMYLHGSGVPVDLVQAYMWYRLATDPATAHLSVRQSADSRLDYLKQNMTPDQIAEAERRARDWKP